MTKKHFIELADAMKALKPLAAGDALAQWKDTVQLLADFCKAQNQGFRRERWLSYINGERGPNDGKL